MDKVDAVTGSSAQEGRRATLSEKQRGWLAHIKRCDSQGESYASYCKRRGLPVKGLYAARKLLQARGHLPVTTPSVPSPARFVPVRLTSAIGAGSVEIALSHGGRLTWFAPNTASVAELVMLLNRPTL